MTWFPEPDPWESGNDLTAKVAAWFAQIDADRAAARLAYCAAHNLDPETWTGCHECEGVGVIPSSGHYCYCDYGKHLQDQHDRRQEREFWQRMDRRTANRGAA